jgi:hypothetical protein
MVSITTLWDHHCICSLSLTKTLLWGTWLYFTTRHEAGIRTVVFPVRDVGNATQRCDLQKTEPIRDVQEPTASAAWKSRAWRLWWQQRPVIRVIHWRNDDTWANVERYTHSPQVALRTHARDRADGGDNIVHLKQDSHFLWIIYVYNTFNCEFHATHNAWLSSDNMNLRQHITVVPLYPWVIPSKSDHSYVKLQIIPNTTHNVIFM